jgi:hypothetical protein
MSRTFRVGILAIGLLTASAAQAQIDVELPRQQTGWSRVRVAKWALLGAAIGFGSYALVQSSRAEDHISALRRECEVEPQGCQLQNGRYSSATAEALYDAAADADRRARIGIIGGQVTLLGSAALFVYDLRNGRGPDDIPLPPTRAAMAVGLRLTF